jgi:hypothetical protein
MSATQPFPPADPITAPAPQKPKRKTGRYIAGGAGVLLLGIIVGAGMTPAAAPETAPSPAAVVKTAAPAPAKAPAAAPAPVAPVVTAGQQNALDKAKSYLDSMAFSRSGLIDQLKYDKFTAADATWAVDHTNANWNDQATAKAKSYLESMPFSHGGLVDQLVYDGFSAAQAEFGVTHAGLK